MREVGQIAPGPESDSPHFSLARDIIKVLRSPERFPLKYLKNQHSLYELKPSYKCLCLKD